MNFEWSLIVDLGILALALVVATLIRAKVRFFQRYLIPNALTAGFLILPYYNFVAPMQGLTSDGLGTLVYHLLNLTFISMTLRNSTGGKKAKGDLTILATSTGTLSQYALQALIGLGLTSLFIATILPDLNPGFGFLLPLGFSLGPGQAYAIGQSWEALGFEGASTLGLTFAAVGFLWACFGGVVLMNYGIRNKWIEKEHLDKINQRGIRSGVFPRDTELPTGSKLTTETEAIDSMTYHAAMIFLVYLISYLGLKGITFLLGYLGDIGNQLAESLWGINFIFSAVAAMLFKQILKLLKVNYTLDNGTLTRISGLSVDLMVTAAIGAISLVVVGKYWLPLSITTIVGGGVTILTVPWIASRLFKDHRFHRTMMIYGASTGTMPTGLSLLRAMDPEFETPVASDYMFSSGITFVLAIPFILVINFPALSKFNENPVLFWSAFFVAAGYFIYVTVMFFVIAKKRAFMKKKQVWLEDEEKTNK